MAALLIAVTVSVVNKGRDIELGAHRTEWQFEQHLIDHPDIESRMEALRDDVVVARQGLDELADENERLRKQL